MHTSLNHIKLYLSEWHFGSATPTFHSFRFSVSPRWVVWGVRVLPVYMSSYVSYFKNTSSSFRFVLLCFRHFSDWLSTNLKIEINTNIWQRKLSTILSSRHNISPAYMCTAHFVCSLYSNKWPNYLAVLAFFFAYFQHSLLAKLFFHFFRPRFLSHSCPLDCVSLCHLTENFIILLLLIIMFYSKINKKNCIQ